jgi:hypothetical protein
MQKTNLSLKQITDIVAKLYQFLKKHSPVIFIVIVFSVYGFLIFQINQLSTAEPTPEQVAEQQNLIPRLKIDKEAVNKIEQLEDQNISVQSLFKAARDNPFKDD